MAAPPSSSHSKPKSKKPHVGDSFKTMMSIVNEPTWEAVARRWGVFREEVVKFMAAASQEREERFKRFVEQGAQTPEALYGYGEYRADDPLALEDRIAKLYKAADRDVFLDAQPAVQMREELLDVITELEVREAG